MIAQGLDHPCVVHSGAKQFPFHEQLTAISAAELTTGYETLPDKAPT